mmetsp:Transcript_6262/g.18900  ORF Transcript_6262/g.18900 Transcript_6262/m.18900 type:complete len:125 (+) Transcript_6262:236-610(+)|eukprot:CAMPEP_0198734314 /NCGR_PEP_ID=MMETSP1475-20131203/51721_1 /TAXON_ID= ORGANISM="Unidentified sp., Strain CCMP1999" /NCGR_SAMPLE_ID=MMETSP1475 /ASSEMBLY_ACC=CAM_ASM_001111 /LENGTH=124 /DNA_ID=CAMNT_0044497763 /DNA_START=210 /DNA_END=584 /DNA_ORIENTATION=+
MAEEENVKDGEAKTAAPQDGVEHMNRNGSLTLRLKMHMLECAEKHPKGLSGAARDFGFARLTFYRWRELRDRINRGELHDMSKKTIHRGRKRKLSGGAPRAEDSQQQGARGLQKSQNNHMEDNF